MSNRLQVKWIFTIQYPIEQSPLIIGDKVYVQDNKATVYALDANTGLNLWKAKDRTMIQATNSLTSAWLLKLGDYCR